MSVEMFCSVAKQRKRGEMGGGEFKTSILALAVFRKREKFHKFQIVFVNNWRRKIDSKNRLCRWTQ